MSRRLTRFGLAVCTIFALAGCPDAGTVTPEGDSAAPESGSTVGQSDVGTHETEPSTETAVTADAEVTLEPMHPQDYQALLDQHRGKVIVIDFWATWCIPCIKGMPHTVQWSQDFDSRDVSVLTVSLDEPEDKTDAALGILRDKGAAIPNYISSIGGADEAFDKFDIDGGSLPHYKVYDREGNLVNKFGGDVDNPFDHTDVEAAIREALGT